ncbi:glycoside hydrolase family 79 protein [Xylariales sp. AK1849]|nr:glycoside hydrolase family 79 protein [Xylariales sp. AK1849]
MRSFTWLLVSACTVLGQVQTLDVSIDIADISTGAPLESFVSYSIEFSSFPDFAGSKASPNKFSNTLLNNIGYLQGTKPYIRVGGNTQDYAIYNEDLDVPIEGSINPNRSQDYPTTIEIGPAYFEAYSTWPNVKFSHGFNLGGNNDSRVLDTLRQTIPLACKALSNGNLYWWEYGNEPDLYATSSQGPVRPSDYNESDYVNEWLTGTRMIKEGLEANCPELVYNNTYGYLAPSFAGTNNHLKAPLAWSDGINIDSNIKYYSTHNYISGATSPGVTLQGTLMNHTRTKQSVDAHVTEYNTINPGVPQIFGETNSLYNQGRPGLSNTFGAALWGIDFLLYSASVNIQRVHLHMGTNYRYQSWQPLTTNLTTIGTKAPYYGNIAVAAFLGNLQIEPVRIAELDTGGGEREAAYLAYVDNVLRRILILNMNEYNYTLNGTGPGLNPNARITRTYSFNVGNMTSSASIQRLYANGSDAITGITWDGWSYNYELNGGRPVLLDNVTVGETVPIQGGIVDVGVADSQAVILNLDYPSPF